jgi:hypothetical protein
MAVSDTATKMDGITSNPGLFVSGPSYVSDGAKIVQGTNYWDGQAVRGTYAGQDLIATGWFAAGTFNNIVTPLVYIEGDNSVTGAAASANMYLDKLKITIYKRMPGTTSSTSTEVFVNYVKNISNKNGIAPHHEELNRPTWLPLWFDPRYEYKFVISVNVITTGAYLDVEGMYLQYVDVNGYMAGRQVQYGNQINMNLAQGIPIIDAFTWGGTSTSNGSLYLHIPSEYFPFNYNASSSSLGAFTSKWDSTLGTPDTGTADTNVDDNTMKAMLSSVEVVTCTLNQGTYGTLSSYGIHPWMRAGIYTDGSNGGFGIYISIEAGPSIGAQYFSGRMIVVGYTNAKAV